MIPGAAKPPPMAGHSATVHGQSMIIFGGLQKQRSSIGQFSSSNDVWIFDIKSKAAFYLEFGLVIGLFRTVNVQILNGFGIRTTRLRTVSVVQIWDNCPISEL